ncbi:exo-beta-N-acetylmuramidase NamZ family protein [Vagococcus carniphilus]|uniref:exo-beta-N-acetylmuramidase NamZ family protein n=1 Tax=Vagococcus carniphilus TaxID=218144 RepID=UPI003BADB0BC
MSIVQNGIDYLKGSPFEENLKGKKVGLITNVTGLTKEFDSNVSVLDELCNLTILFAPEHGIRGEAQAGEDVASYFDPYFSKKVISLYGDKRAPSLEDIKELDVLVYDIQDIGSRYYTYIYTMYLSMKVAKEADIQFIVLDRVDVLGGNHVFGHLMPEAYFSFVGMLPIPNVYGMTVGELAYFCNEELAVQADLVVVPIKGWKRGMTFEETGLPWVMPSPNIPTPETAWLYTGTCLIEGTNLSEGRGTTKPFEIIGAPFINGTKLAENLNELSLPGIKFRPVFFTPTFSKHQGEACEGVQCHVLDKEKSEPLDAVYKLLRMIQEMYPDQLEVKIPFETSPHLFFTHLAGHPYEVSMDDEELVIEFKEKRSKYLLYK